jgi:hypothetical protein
MRRRVLGGLIRAAVPLTDPALPIDKISWIRAAISSPLAPKTKRSSSSEMDLDVIEEVRRAWRRPGSDQPMATVSVSSADDLN